MTFIHRAKRNIWPFLMSVVVYSTMLGWASVQFSQQTSSVFTAANEDWKIIVATH